MDKTSRLGTVAENQRLVNGCAKLDLQDAFRTLYPVKKEYTFYSRSARVSSRIDRALVSSSLFSAVGAAFHSYIPKGITDHWFAVSVKLASYADREKGPGLWRLPAKLAGSKGVRNITQAVTQQQDGKAEDFPLTLKRLQAGLKEYAKGERKRVARTVEHLEEKAAALKQAYMSDAGDASLQEQLAKCEAQLKSYWDGKQEWLQTLAGIKGELDGEIASKLLSGRVASRKAKTEIPALSVGGKAVKGAKEILEAASDFFRDLFGKAREVSGELWLTDKSKRLNGKDQEMLQATWTEAEVRKAIAELPKGKTPGSDGLPREIFAKNWDLLGPGLMDFLHSFERSARLPESLTTAVTILLHKKGD
ncbi:unnamed protein product [Closterium sp. Yama58-4]|nr:unnamed protein product [Closterium sp. Yama58-4]